MNLPLVPNRVVKPKHQLGLSLTRTARELTFLGRSEQPPVVLGRTVEFSNKQKVGQLKLVKRMQSSSRSKSWKSMPRFDL